MTLSTNKVTIAMGVIILLAIGMMWFLISNPDKAFGASPAGSNYTTSKLLGQQVTTGTTTAIAALNTTTQSDIVKNAEVVLYNGISTTTSYTIACATSTSASSLNGNTNYVLDMTINAVNSQYGTTTGSGLFMSSSSPGITGIPSFGTTIGTTTLETATRVVPANTYLACLVTTADGANALNSGVQGTITFPVIAQ